MYVSIQARKLNDEDSLCTKIAVECGYEFSFGHYIDDDGTEKIDYTSLRLCGGKKDSYNIERDFEIEISPSEISELVGFIIENKLIRLHAETSYRDC
jgi:hypothetical protein